MALRRFQVTTDPKVVAVTGKYFKIVQASGEINVRFELMSGEESETGLYQGQGVRFPEKYRRVWLWADESLTVTLWSGLGELVDERSETTLSGSANLSTDAISLAAGTSKLVCQNRLGRRSALIQCDIPFFIGGAGVTIANGFPVEDSIEIDTQAEIYAVCDSAAEIRILEELN